MDEPVEQATAAPGEKRAALIPPRPVCSVCGRHGGPWRRFGFFGTPLYCLTCFKKKLAGPSGDPSGEARV